MEIKDAIVLVTGGAAGLGLAISDHLSCRGAKILIADRDKTALENLPEHFDHYMVDVTHCEDVKSMVAKIFEKHGRIDALINNAGVIHSEPFVNLFKPQNMMHDYQTFRSTMTLNLDTVFIMTSAVVEQKILKRQPGVIINISSISAGGNAGQTAYSAAKSGVNAMTIAWSKELGGFGIRCNAVAPGFIESRSTRAAISESMIKHVQSNTPIRRLGKAVEVAKAVEHLIENDFLNGVIFNVDGGLRI